MTYDLLRRPDFRLAVQIDKALGTARTVVNVGAGAGSYEPAERDVTAVEPSAEMIRKRSIRSARAVQATAEALPFPDKSFDAAMAVLTIHHWQDQEAGLREMRRVSRGPVVIVTFDPASRPWLTDYLPQLAELDERQMPPIDFYQRCLGEVSVEKLLVPHDCTDGFLYAFWRRPLAYLDPALRKGSSSFWALGKTLEPGLERLRSDLAECIWHRRYDHLLTLDSYDVGYRIVIAG
ncbi:class I SAM-dependent methyltransferase [Novosphingobium sp. MMS21-SN21R]|uniref:class I SAM-dependent methyltransferase n=1 Tax=Novosphingobium sp. MMS21-SN21R TaxID=2969298 RepID=UPI0028868BE3|nr:class I SAM-dependent methyltransferase [Novosphingobium sp. MMS21-SN21R]MDT0507414.1 class I SAM-dependent methyltransferase [Novosphingobium sp. MMS21-SN21R]